MTKYLAPRPISSISKFSLILFILCILATTYLFQGTQQTNPVQQENTTLLYANQIDGNLTHLFTSAIDNAKDSILLIVYSLTDKKIIASLKEKSLQGVNVSVICDAQTSPHVDQKLGYKVKTIRRYSPGLMHQKILVIDKKQSWIGSANMTAESLGVHSNLITVVDSKPLADYLHSKALTMKIEGVSDPIFQQEFVVDNQTLEMWYLPDNDEAVYRLKALIKKATKTIRIAMFTWTRFDLANAVIEATKKGVDVEVVIDYYAGKGSSVNIVKFLKKCGIKIRLSRGGGALLHDKFLSIDQETLVNGSANWTKAAFTKNDDCFLVLHPLTKKQEMKMEALWKIIWDESIAVNE